MLVELDGNVVTEKGKTLLKNLDLFAKVHTNADIEEAFKVWWKNYPSYDDHGQWARTRRIKTSKTRAETLYRDLLRGGVSADFLLKAVDAEVDFRKKNSVKSNALQYMSNPATWLYQKEFEAYEDTPATDINDFIGYGKEID